MDVRFGLLPFNYLPWIAWDPMSSVPPEGFIVDVVRELGTFMNWNITFVPTGVAFAMGEDTYLHQIRQELVDGQYDLGLLYYDDPITGFAPELASVRQTVSFHTQWHAVGIQKVQVEPSLFALFDPFETQLWLAIGGFALTYGLLLYVLNFVAAKREGSEKLPSLRDLLIFTYHSVSMVLDGEEFDRWRTLSLRLARVGMLFFVVVFSATYTANLAAFFTKPAFRLEGPITYQALSQAKTCVQQSVILSVVEQSIGPSYILPPPDVQMDLLATQEWCAAAVLDGRADAMISLAIQLKDFLSRGGCSNISHVDLLDFAPVPFTFGYRLTPSLPADFGEQLDSALVKLLRTERFTELRTKYLYNGFYCPGEGPEDVGETDQVTLYQMRGLFLCCGVLAAFALLAAAAELIWHYRPSRRIVAGEGEANTVAENLQKLMTKVDDLSARLYLSAEGANRSAPSIAFELLDKNGNGLLTKAELLSGVRNHRDVRRLLGLQDNLTVLDLEQIFQEIDAGDTGDRQITLNEFEIYCKSHLALPKTASRSV